jgi:hypothetical protein
MHRILAILLLATAAMAADAVVLESKTKLNLHSNWGTDTWISIIVDVKTGARIMLIRSEKDEGGITALVLPPKPQPVQLPAEAPLPKAKP